MVANPAHGQLNRENGFSGNEESINKVSVNAVHFRPHHSSDVSSDPTEKGCAKRCSCLMVILNDLETFETEHSSHIFPNLGVYNRMYAETIDRIHPNDKKIRYLYTVRYLSRAGWASTRVYRTSLVFHSLEFSTTPSRLPANEKFLNPSILIKTSYETSHSPWTLLSIFSASSPQVKRHTVN